MCGIELKVYTDIYIVSLIEVSYTNIKNRVLINILRYIHF